MFSEALNHRSVACAAMRARLRLADVARSIPAQTIPARSASEGLPFDPSLRFALVSLLAASSISRTRQKWHKLESRL